MLRNLKIVWKKPVETYSVYINFNEIYVKRADGLTQFDFCYDIVMLSLSNKSMQQLFCLFWKYVPKFGISWSGLYAIEWMNCEQAEKA